MTESIEKELLEEIKEDHKYIVSLRRHFHMNPEIAKAHKDLGIIYLNKRLFCYIL